MSAADKNIVLIGMPGVGKSTVGVLLAKELSRDFLDTDVLIQSREGRRLKDIIRGEGVENFRKLEEKYILTLDCRGGVIATGGSVVYSEQSMDHLRSGGVMVHLALPLHLLEARIENLEARGVVRAQGQSLRDLYAERMPLYRRYQDHEIDCAGHAHEDVLRRVMEAVAPDL